MSSDAGGRPEVDDWTSAGGSVFQSVQQSRIVKLKVEANDRKRFKTYRTL